MMVRTMALEEARDLPLDPLATLTMTYTGDGFKELVQDIKKNGQLVPIVLRGREVLDGRHRLAACIELGIDVRYQEVGLIPEQEALDLVISNSINKATGTDASKVEAYLMCKAKGVKQKEMPSTFSRLNINYIRKLAFIEKENPEYLQILLRQNSVRLHNKEFNKLEDYGTINGVWRTLKGNKRLEEEVVEVVVETAQEASYETCIDQVMVNSAAEQEYWDIYELGKLNGASFHADSVVGKRIIALINHKYKVIPDV